MMALLIYFFGPQNLEPRLCAAIISWVAFWWLTPLIPLSVTGLLGICLAQLAGLSSWKALLAPFADPIIFLFMGGFMLARAVEVRGLDRWWVNRAQSIIGNRPRRMYLTLVVLAAGLSAFLSNTATTALLLPVGIELLRRSKLELKTHAPLLLMLAGASSIGGSMTPVGSPPNMVALGLMEKMLGTRPDFLTWMLHMVPLSLSILAALLLLYRPLWRAIPESGDLGLTQEGALSLQQKTLMLLIGLTFCGWLFPGLLKAFHLELPVLAWAQESSVAFIAMVLLFLIPTPLAPLLRWEEAKDIDWGTLLLFGAGLSLGQLAFETGLAQILAQRLQQISHFPPRVLFAVAILGTLFLTEIASNTATANLVTPILLAGALGDVSPALIIFAIVAASNFAFMLPVGTPPNAIVYSTGLIPITRMIGLGLRMNLMAFILILGFVLFIF